MTTAATVTPSRPLLATFEHLRADAGIHAFVLVYALATALAAYAAGVPDKFAISTYFSWLVVGLGPAASLTMAMWLLWSLRSPSPLRALRDSGRAAVSNPRTGAVVLLFVTLLLFESVFVSAKTMLTNVVPFYADPPLAELDRILHGRDPWVYVHTFLPRALGPVLEVLYFPVWALLIHLTTIAVIVLPQFRQVRQQYLWTFLIVWPLLGNVIAAVWMSAGPVFYERVTGDARFSALLAQIGHVSVGQEWGRELLWKLYVRNEGGSGAAISAFPSLHVASTTLLVLAARSVDRRLLAFAMPYGIAVLLGSVYFGWHYAVDGYASVLATVLIWAAVGLVIRRRSTSQQSKPSWRG